MSVPNHNNNIVQPTVVNLNSPTGDALSLEYLKSISPTYQGFCEKESSSFLSYWLPWLFPRWKRRFIILCGNYLFRFPDDETDILKGIPIPMDSSQIKYIEGSHEFTLTNLWKDYNFRITNEIECKNLVKILRNRKLEAIRENMGHAPLDSHIKHINKIAYKKLKKKMKYKMNSNHNHHSDDIFNPIAYNATTLS